MRFFFFLTDVVLRDSGHLLGDLFCGFDLRKGLHVYV